MEKPKKISISDNIRIRKENGFYLITNVNPDSIIKGYPSFFKMNEGAKEAICVIQKNTLLEKKDLVSILCEKFMWDNGVVTKFIDRLLAVGICSYE